MAYTMSTETLFAFYPFRRTESLILSNTPTLETFLIKVMQKVGAFQLIDGSLCKMKHLNLITPPIDNICQNHFGIDNICQNHFGVGHIFSNNLTNKTTHFQAPSSIAFQL